MEMGNCLRYERFFFFPSHLAEKSLTDKDNLSLQGLTKGIRFIFFVCVHDLTKELVFFFVSTLTDKQETDVFICIQTCLAELAFLYFA